MHEHMTANECGLRKGVTVTYRNLTGLVLEVEGNLCWTQYSDGSKAAPFIWRFHDGLNNMHHWPNKPDAETYARNGGTP